MKTKINRSMFADKAKFLVSEIPIANFRKFLKTECVYTKEM